MKTRLPLKVAAASLLTVAAAVILWACQKEKYPDDTIDAEIARSAEMENYIVAGYELQAALVEFQKTMNAIDWSQMHYVKDENGNEVMHLPVQSLIFEAKLNQFNDKKNILQRKYRRLTSYSQEKCEDMIQYCLDNSVTVNTKLLDMGINIFQPITKFMDDPDIFNKQQLHDSLVNYVRNPNYVETLFIQYYDSSYVMYIHSTNTDHRAYTPEMEGRNGKLYWPGGDRPNDPIINIGHTHRDSASPSDSDRINKIPIIDNTIFWNGNFYKY